jgi:hypothetical protein
VIENTVEEEEPQSGQGLRESKGDDLAHISYTPEDNGKRSGCNTFTKMGAV